MKQPLNKLVSDKFDDASLTEEQLDNLLALQNKSKNESISINDTNKTTAIRKSWLTLTIASAAMLMVVFSGWYLEQYNSVEGAIMRVANEVSKNHSHLKPLEVQTDDMLQLSSYFSLLDFKPASSTYFNSRAQLLGGRYCSISGETAAQIRYRNSQGEVATLFETDYDSDLFGFLPNIKEGGTPIETYAKGFKIKMWIERGLVMVSVNDE